MADGEATNRGRTDEEQPEDECPTVGLVSPLAAALADLHSIAGDLQFVIDACDILAEPERERDSEEESSADPKSEESVIRRALWQAALISYRRCFTGGKGHLLPGRTRLTLPMDRILPALDAMSGGEATSTHAQALEQADRHIAHRVSDLEQIRILAILAPRTQEPSLLGIGHLIANLVLQPELVPRLGALAGKLREILLADIEQATGRVAEQARLAGLDFLYQEAERLAHHSPGASPPADAPGSLPST